MGRPTGNTAILTGEEIRSAFAGTRWEEVSPPVLTVEQAAELAHVPPGTIYDWSSRGEPRDCATRRGRRIHIWRDRFVLWLFEFLWDRGD